MARPDRDGKGPTKRWREAALGGALVALGSALFGVSRGSAKGRTKGRTKPGDTSSGREPGQAGKNKGGARPDPKSRPTVSRAKVRTKPNRPEVTARTQYWPPPPPKPLDVYDDGISPPEQAIQNTKVPVDEASVKRGYEAGDAKPGTIVKVMLGSACAIVCAVAVLFVLVSWRGRDARQAPPLTPQQLAVIVPPGPRLQDHPIHDIAMENKRETDLLSYYAWTGPDHRSGRIPIGRAQALVIGRPLDPLPSPAPQPAGGPAAPPTGPAPVPAQNP
jgi:hypothetical protein